MTALQDPSGATGHEQGTAGHGQAARHQPAPEHDERATDHEVAAPLRASFAAGVTRPLEWRRRQLVAMRRMLVEHEADFLAALSSDLGKSATEGWMTELRHVTYEIDHVLARLERWARPERVPVRAALRPARAQVVSEPLGVVLVIAPWNYPIHLLLLPMVYALAAGNSVVGKPSEVAPVTSAAVARWVPSYLDPRAVAIVEGDAAVATSLLAARWDHIFYTGSGRVGRIVAAAAARHLTPVTLELGGKSPAIVDASADIEVAARRIAWGKWLNAGQTCVAPDYVLVDTSVADELVEGLRRALHSFYGEDPARSADYGRIVNEAHWDRLQALIEGRRSAQVAVGGQGDRARRYLAPTILTDVGWDEPVMGEEIFGPILPILTVEGVDQAVEAVNRGDKPLALYVFAQDQDVIDDVVARTSSGGVCANATLTHLAVPGLPFGGVGASGMGAYHGRAGFDTFSHRKAVLQRRTRPDPSATYPPYGSLRTWLIRRAF
jgi:aldehyde dehydrogenase (NAD+)